MSVYGERAVGGAERTAFDLAKGLVKRGHRVHLLSLSSKGQPPPLTRVEDGVQCEFIPLIQLYDPFDAVHQCALGSAKNFFFQRVFMVRKALWHVIDIFNLAMAFRVRKRLASIRPDVLLTHTLQGFSVAVWFAAKSLGIKIVHMTHDHALICPGTAMTRGIKVCESVCASCQIFCTLRKTLATMPHAVAGPSRVVLNRHQQFGWFRQVSMQRVIPNALPANWHALDALELPGSREVTVQNPMVFGFLGRLDESKGADTIVRALCLLPQTQLGLWRMVFAGQGSLAQLHHWVLSLEHGQSHWDKVSPFVSCLGLVNANVYLRSIDVLLMPSRAHETFCNVVQEAGSLARPAIVSDKGALPERIAQGLTGWMVPAADEPALAEKIHQLLCNPRQVQQKAIRAWESSQAYSSKQQLDLMERLLQDVLHG
jgi:glycogen synthase